MTQWTWFFCARIDGKESHESRRQGQSTGERRAPFKGLGATLISAQGAHDTGKSVLRKEREEGTATGQ